ncbi:TPA: hypothetical protein KQE75_002540 [Clostridioides difficile]|uniref:hypothetical protein n=1 Tax=Clostridioides difficile TaxID=1496 RepID=UPI0003B2AEE6|nr:hypothetical protein [Clostridioides difficile]CCL32277.1 hypothetical protein BN174_3910002 [Clostridioides difficile E15]HBG4629302.1 hypothetical protein [Clostridioides difficile]
MKYKDGDTRVKFLFGIVALNVLFVLAVYFGIKQYEEERERYRLDYILEDKVVKVIESNHVVDMEKLSNLKFSKIRVQSPGINLGDYENYFKKFNTELPNNNLKDRSNKEYSNKNNIFKFNRWNIQRKILYLSLKR